MRFLLCESPRGITHRAVSAITLHQLRTFLAVARTASLTKAARELNSTQPTVSLQLSAIQRGLGAKLIERSGAAFRLTPAGEQLRSYAEQALRGLRTLHQDIAAFERTVGGPLAVGATFVMSRYVLPSALSRFRVQFPRVSIQLHVELPGPLLAALQADELDVGCFIDLSIPSGFTAERLCEEELVIVASPKHPLAGRRRVDPDALARQPFIAPMSPSLRALIEAKLLGAGVRPMVAAQGRHHDAIKDLVQSNVGYSVLLRACVAAELADGQLVRLNTGGPPFRVDIVAMYRSRPRVSPLIQKFIQLLRSDLTRGGDVTTPKAGHGVRTVHGKRGRRTGARSRVGGPKLPTQGGRGATGRRTELEGEPPAGDNEPSTRSNGLLITYHQLRTFLAVIRTASLTKAARELNTSQPTVSLQLRALRKSLGTDLLERSGNGLHVTPSGEMLRRFADETLGGLRILQQDLAGLKGNLAGDLAVGTTFALSDVLASLSSRFRAQFPSIVLQLHVDIPEHLFEHLATGALDAAFYIHVPTPAGLAVEQVGDEELVIIAAPQHSLASRRQIPPGELNGQPLVASRPGLFRESLNAKLRSLGVSPGVVTDAQNFDAVKRLVAENKGISIYAKRLIASEIATGQLVRLDVDCPPIIADIVLAYRNAPVVPPLIKEFIPFLRDEIRASRGGGA